MSSLSALISSAPSWSVVTVLLIIGALFGVINTLAGGGSILSLPALLFLDVAPHAANATNRVAGVTQTISAVIGFWRGGALSKDGLWVLIFYALLGGFLGPWVSLQMNQESMRVCIQICLALIALFTLFAPARLFQDPPPPPKSKTIQHLVGFSVAFYGGFLQAGIGLVSLYYLRFICGYDLVKGTAVKTLFILSLTIPALGVFIWHGEVQWLIGSCLALGSIGGAWFGVRLSLSPKGSKIIRIALPITAILMVISLMVKSF
jgi:uncharacterized membrane protein YfcA